MKKKYEPVDEMQEIIIKLLDLGVKVTASNGVIRYIEVDPDLHNINTLENMTGLKFKEKKEK